MELRRVVCCFVLIIANLGAGPLVFGGKISRIRDATQARSHDAAGTNPPALSSPRDLEEPSDHQGSDHDPKEQTGESRQPTRKLASIRELAHRRDHVAPNRLTSRSRHGHAPRRFNDRIGCYFDSHYSAPVCLPTVVEEHRYYERQSIVVSESAIMPEQPTVEYVQEPMVVHENPFEMMAPLNVRFEVDYATDEADVDRTGFGFLINATGGLGVDSGLRIYREADGDFRDHIWLGDLNVVYELFPTEFVRTRAGLGINWLADKYGAECGLNLTLGTDLFAGPIVLSGEVDLGTLGDADLFHGRLTAAVRPGEHLEWFAGYDFVDIGGTEIRGFVGGLRFRF